MSDVIDKKIGGGLTELPEDGRDFSFGGIFGLPKLSELPEEYRVDEPIRIKDQGNSDMCTAYAVTAVSEDQEDVELSPEYQFAKTKEIDGDPDAWGANLRDACKSATEFGSLAQIILDRQASEYKYDGKNRNKIANWNGMGFHAVALSRKKKTYFKVDGQYDTFDNIRAAMWQSRDEKRSIVTGAQWRHPWTNAQGGIIPTKEMSGGFGHAFKIFGWRMVQIYPGPDIFGHSIPFLVAQLSNGTEIGDGGIFYFPREVVNREFTFGSFMFRDMPRDEAEYLSSNGIRYGSNWLVKLFYTFINLFKT